MKRYLYARTTDGTTVLLLSRYEFLIYQLLRAALEAGDICCPQSVRFRSIEDNLIPTAEWQQHKDSYLAATQRPVLLQPIIDHLAALEQELEKQFDDVNGRIAAGKNSPVQITQPAAMVRSLKPITRPSKRSIHPSILGWARA